MNYYSVSEKSDRKKQFDRLKVFLVNPGKFSLLVLGSRGSGKKYSIKCAYEAVKHDKSAATRILEFIDCTVFPIERDEIDDFLEPFQDGILVIESIEKFSEKQQLLLFETLSTVNGLFGIDKEFNIRFVFTSSVDPDLLREEDTGKLHGNIWDRISQLVVKLPSFETENDNIVRDFEAVWNKMKFEGLGYSNLSKLPKNAKLESFLQNNATRFEGGFRDLDKLAAMYFNYRLLFYKQQDVRPKEETEKQVVNEVQSDFFGISQHKTSTTESLKTFIYADKVKYTDLLHSFKKQLRQWAYNHYGGAGKAAKVLGIDSSTMRKW